MAAANRRIDVAKAARALSSGFSTTAADGRRLAWGKTLADKYLSKDQRRLMELPKAVLAATKANFGTRERGGGQVSYLHKLNKRSAMVVFAKKATGEVVHIGYTSDKKPGARDVEKFIGKHLTRD